MRFLGAASNGDDLMVKRLFFSIFLVCFSVTSTAYSINILCLGDSLTEGYGVARSEAWPALVEVILREKKINVTLINAGISGSTTASAPSRLRWHLKSKESVDWMILALGANDGLRGQPVEGIKKNLEGAIQVARSAGVKKIILAGMKIPPNYGNDYSEKFATVYPAVAKAFKISLIPFLLDGVGAKPELNLPDGIHPNAKGHKIIAQNVAKFIEAQL